MFDSGAGAGTGSELDGTLDDDIHELKYGVGAGCVDVDMSVRQDFREAGPEPYTGVCR